MPRPGPLSLPAPPPSLPAHQGIRARDQLHRHLEEAIAEKLHEDAAGEPGDALAMIIHSTRELGHELSVQELKVGGARSLLPSCSPRGYVSTLSLNYSSGRGGKDQASGRGSARPTLRGSLEGLSPRVFWTQPAPLPSPFSVTPCLYLCCPPDHETPFTPFLYKSQGLRVKLHILLEAPLFPKTSTLFP